MRLRLDIFPANSNNLDIKFIRYLGQTPLHVPMRKIVQLHVFKHDYSF